MGKMIGLLAVTGLIAFVTVDANAQRQGGFGGGFGGGSGFGLLQNKGVQEELKITEEQSGKIKTAAEEFGKKFPRPQFGKKDNSSKEDREKTNKERTEATNKALAEILSKEQITRMKQIERQQDPARTLTNDEDAVKELKLTDEQKEKIKGLQDENRKEMGSLFGGGGGKDAFEKMTTLRKELKEKTLKILTTDQMKTWAELTGKPFEVKFEGFGMRPNTGTTPKKKDD